MPIVDPVLLDTALFFLTFGAPAIAFAVMLYLSDRDRDRAQQSFEERHAALGLEHSGLLRALEFEGVSGDERNRRIAAMKELVNDAQTWLDYVRALPPAAASHLMQNVTPQDLVRMLELQHQWSTDGMEATLSTLRSRLADVAHMDVVLRDQRAQELGHITPAIERGLWTFEPDFVVDPKRHRTNVSVRTIANELYGRDVADTISQRPDIVARTRSQLSLQPNHQWQDGEEGTLLLELKNTRTSVGTAEQTQASGYIRQLVRTGALPEREPVDCYVIGGGIHDHEGGPRIEGWYHNVRITSVSYDQMIERAKRLTLGIYDQIKDVAPFVVEERHLASKLLSESKTDDLPMAAE
jgi:hypothetical protein